MDCDLVPAHSPVFSTNFHHSPPTPMPWTHTRIPILCFASSCPCHLNSGSPVLHAYVAKSFLAFKSLLKDTSSTKSSLIYHIPNHLSSLVSPRMFLCFSVTAILMTANAANQQTGFWKHQVREQWFQGRDRQEGHAGRGKLQCQMPARCPLDNQQP